MANQHLLLAALNAQEQVDVQSAVAVRLRELVEAQDASERRFRRRAAELQATIDGIDDGFALVNGVGDIPVANEALARTLGRPVKNEAELRAALGGAELQSSRQPTRLQLVADRRWLEVRTFGVVDPLDDAPSRVVLIRDITAQRATDQAREAFLDVLSHELRTPVTTILGMARLLDQPRVAADEAQQRELVRDIGTEAERLHRLIEDMLVLSRSEHGQLAIEPEPLLVQHIIAEAVTAEARHFPLVRFVSALPKLPPVLADRTAVSQIMRNLLSNAGKYGPIGHCEVHIVAEAAADVVVVRVLDDGPGFALADVDRLFDLYFRSRDSSTRQPGAGIGLYVTRALVEALGGRISASVREPRGSEFGFTLPIATVDDLEDHA